MKTSRRHFLSQSALTAAGVILVPRTAGAPLPTGTLLTPSSGGLLFDRDDLPRLRETVKLPRFSAFWNSMSGADLDADRRFLKEELQLNNHVKHLLQARQILERTSFVYALTGDAKQAETAVLAIGRILQYKKWDYFLDGGEFTIGLQRAPETTIAMCCAREWLDDVLDPQTKGEMEKQIAEKGAPACYRTLYGMKYPDRVRGWGFDPESDYKFRFDLSRWPYILNSTNLKAIPIAGLGMAGCLLHGKHPDAGRWVEMALKSAKAFSAMFGSDGSYDEGVGYWGYTAQHLTLLVEVLRRRLGIDERGIINFPGTVRYGLRMSMPTKDRVDDCVNFGDAWAMGDLSVAAWTARTFRDAIAQYVASTIGEIRNHLAMIWFDPSLVPETPGPDLYDVRFANDIVVARTGWDVQSSVVALRSGGPANHEHADRNSVIFKAYGERLFHDPFKAAYSYMEPHWLLRKTEAHTAVLIDGKGHQYHDGHEGTNASWAEAKIVDYKPGNHHLVVTSDATEAYRLVNGNVEVVQRTLLFLKPDVLVLCDRVRLKTGAARVQLRFQAYNADGKGTATATPNGFTIGRPAATLRAIVQGLAATTIRTGQLAVPVENGVHPYVEVESESSREHLLCTVCTAQEASHMHGDLKISRTGTSWTVKGTHNGRAIAAVIDTAPDIPAITI